MDERRTDKRTNELLKAAMEYAALGWRVVPLHNIRDDGACTCRKGDRCGKSAGKHPRAGFGWQKLATTEEETILGWWEKWPEANIGVQMGRSSGLIDIECDSPEEERTFLKLFGNDPPPTPTFQSARGKHRLFRWRDDLPGLGTHKIGELVLRIGNNELGSQSVFPPSQHSQGARYQWLVSPDDCSVAELSQEVVARLWNWSGEEPEDDAKRGHGRDLLDKPAIRETVDGRDNTLLAFACREARRSPNINDPEEQADLHQKLLWANECKCRPPLPEGDIQRIHQQAIKYTRKDAEKRNEEYGYTLHGLKYKDGMWLPGEWKLTVVLSDPVEYQLHVPRWSELTDDGTGTIHLSLDEFRSPEKVAAAVQRATKSVVLDDVPRFWPAVWSGLAGNRKDEVKPRRGLKALLIDEATYVNAPPPSKRYVVVAEMFESMISRAKEGDAPDHRRPTLLPDGTIWFRWYELWRDALIFRDVDRREPPELARRLGITEKDYRFYPTSGKRRKRFCVLQPQHAERLTAIIEAERKQTHLYGNLRGKTNHLNSRSCAPVA